MPPLTTAALDTALLHGCQMPGCLHSEHPFTDVVFLHPRCHPKAGTWAFYSATHRGVLRLICKQCRTLVVEVAVAP